MNFITDAGNYIKKIYATPDDGKANNDVFSSMNVDQQGNVINGGYSAEIQRKTPEITPTASTSTKTLVYGSNVTNVLTNYRSYTYRFTLACLTADQLNHPETYIDKPLNLVVLRSGGKGPNAMTPGNVPNTVAANSTPIDNNALINAAIQNANRLNTNSKLIEDFNKNSAGQFDMFIENVSIDTVMTFTEDTSSTQPTTVTFDVTEPYSVNGYLEALAAASVAAGWNNYIEAPFVLLIEWIGYPDDQNITDPVILKEKRYLTLKFGNMDMEITEKGTHYKCTGIPWQDQAHGIAGRFQDTVSATGSTVGELLSDLVKNFNNSLTKIREKTVSKDAAALHDVFDIKFDTIVNGNIVLDTSAPGQYAKTDISQANLYNDIDTKQFAMANAQDQGLGQINYPTANTATNFKVSDVSSVGTHKSAKLTFNNDVNLRDAIAEIIVNSTYVRNMISAVTDGTKYKEAQTVPYFLIYVQTEEIPNRDEIRNVPLRKYIFRILPYEIDIGRIPGFAKIERPLKDLKYRSCRSYNYIYTGNNTEILGFKLQYNYLFFEGIPAAQGANDSDKTKNTFQAPDNRTLLEKNKDYIIGKDNQDNSKNAGTPPTTKVVSSGKTDSPGNSVKANPGDPYQALAINLHKALINPQANMLTANIEIMGDPYFIVTGGIGNQVRTGTKSGGIDDTQAPHQGGDVIIDIVFQNPRDIGSTGFVEYNEVTKSPFHGAYRVMSCVSTFKDGVFKQNLTLTKLSGQDPTNSVQVINADSGYNSVSDPTGATTTEARDESKASNPDSSVSLTDTTNLGTPTPTSKFVNNAGAIGYGPLSQTFGVATDGLGKLTAQANLFGNAVVGGAQQLIKWNPTQTLNGVESKIAGLQGNISSLIPSAANIDQQISGLAKGLVGNVSASFNSVLNTLPSNVDLQQAATDGLSLKNIGNNFSNIPPSQPRAVVTDIALSVDDQQLIASKGVSGLADSRGVYVAELGKNAINSAEAEISSLGNSSQSLISRVSNIQNALQNPAQSAASPLTKLIGNISNIKLG